MPASAPAVPRCVAEILAQAQARGFLGPGSLDGHIEHSLGFARTIAAVCGRELGAEDLVLDLGTGGGLPGLVLAAAWPLVPFRLVEGSMRRAEFLRLGVDRCGWTNRVEVVAARAEEVGRVPGRRGGHSVVVARLFGRPAVTAECAAPLLMVGGVLVVSEPPGSQGERWPAAGLAELGLVRERTIHADARFQVLRQAEACPDRFPRRVGVPARRPLF